MTNLLRPTHRQIISGSNLDVWQDRSQRDFVHYVAQGSHCNVKEWAEHMHVMWPTAGYLTDFKQVSADSNNDVFVITGGHWLTCD